MADIGNSVVAITGASSGIGAATAQLLAARGARVVLGARSVEPLRRLARTITECGGSAVSAPTDVTRREDLLGLVATAREHYGRLDAIVNNAGIMPVSPLSDLKVDEWEAMVDVNLKGVLFGIAAALPVFLQQGSGHIVTVASTAALTPLPTTSIYAATKAALRTMSDGMRQELDGTVRVTTIVPGRTRTNFSSTTTNQQVKAQLEQRRDARSMPPEAVAEAIAYALSQPDGVDIGEIVVRPGTPRAA
ncbi:SDR family oxidoreductase [uncultured Amnibacterium sp.]|uniref:SDR family oxidoreductase n=1 Tax=uncultured Amnibacterium sp. TaxID=1631851 RepID=UPI0035CC27A7